MCVSVASATLRSCDQPSAGICICSLWFPIVSLWFGWLCTFRPLQSVLFANQTAQCSLLSFLSRLFSPSVLSQKWKCFFIQPDARPSCFLSVCILLMAFHCLVLWTWKINYNSFVLCFSLTLIWGEFWSWSKTNFALISIRWKKISWYRTPWGKGFCGELTNENEEQKKPESQKYTFFMMLTISYRAQKLYEALPDRGIQIEREERGRESEGKSFGFLSNSWQLSSLTVTYTQCDQNDGYAILWALR